MRNFSIFTLLAALLFVGCSDIFVELESPLTNETTLPDLTANFADDGLTRTYVEEGKYLRWHEADLITAFFGNTLNRQYKFKGKTGDNSGTFSLIPSGELGTGNDLDAIYALYPYDENATISDEGVISLTLPSEQSYAENSFGKGANTMVAVTESVEDTFLSFKNACGYLKLYLYNVDGATLKSVSVKGNNNEKIAGAATVAMTFGDTPEVTMSDDATTSVTLDCGEGIALGTTSETATALWIVLPETTFENGITISATDTKGGVFEKSTSNSVAITRNDIQPMAALAVEFVAPVVKPANNEIWYTNGSTTEATTPYKTNVFGVNIVSNTYDAEKECWVIKFDGDVTTIGDYAFYNCKSITTITIPDNVTTIGRSAFSKCSGLTSITIPDSVTSIGSSAFNRCTGELIVNCNIPSALGYNDGAFYGSEFTSAAIGDSVTTIGDYAFYNCSSLTTITIPDSVTTIGNSAFYACSGIINITIGNGVTKIGYNAFRSCTSLTSATIGDNVTTISDNAFRMCSSLQEFKGNLASEDGRCLIIEGVLESFAPAGITEYTIPDGVTTIGDNAFYYCSGLTSLTIPDGVTTIGNYAFDSCSNLTSVTFGNSVTTIGDNAFYYCSGLTSLTIPDSVTTIGDNAFCDCSGLTSVTIGNSVTTIGYYAFYDCSSLTSITIPDSVTTIGTQAFDYCTCLTNIYITDIVAWCNISFENGNSNPLCNGGNLYINNETVADLTIPDSVTTIGDWAFLSCEGLTSVNIPDSVTTIGNYAFCNCSSLTSVTIPDSVTSIGDDAFYNCSGLTSITIPDSVTSIGSSAFSECSGLTSVTIPDSVTSIGKSAFYYCISLTSVTIPDSVTSIGGSAFESCFSLTSITIPDSVTSIGGYAFYYCSSLTSVTIPDSVTTIGNRAFDGCSSLTNVYCMATTPPTVGYDMFNDNALGRTIYVPTESVDAYKTAQYWSNYKNYIVGYDF